LSRYPGRARLDRAQDVGVGLVGGQDEDARARTGRDDLLGRRHAVAAGHPQVHQDDVVPAGPGLRHRLGPGGRLAGHLDAGLGGQHPAQPGPDHRVVVGQQHADHPGTSARTSVPRPGAEATSTVPPTWRTRSRMPTRP
jgi:hypothetical protein